MEISFYEYAKRFANPEANDPISRFANRVKDDISFPKHATNFDEISRYLEGNPDYGKLLAAFDDLWAKYQFDFG